MTQVPFTPIGIALKQHELYGLDDDMLFQEAASLRNDIVNWSINHFLLNDDQINWLQQQDDRFTVEFAATIQTGLQKRWDINIQIVGPDKPVPKSKNIGARENVPLKAIEILVVKSDE